jgi:hypothetical protein
MTKVSKNLKCILTRSGVELWLEEEFLAGLENALLNSKESKFLEIGEEVINTADIVGVFNAKTMEELTRRKNGQWKCEFSTWHNRGENCFCWEKERYKNLDRLDNSTGPMIHF